MMQHQPDTDVRVTQLAAALDAYVEAQRTRGKLPREPAPGEAMCFEWQAARLARLIVSALSRESWETRRPKGPGRPILQRERRIAIALFDAAEKLTGQRRTSGQPILTQGTKKDDEVDSRSGPFIDLVARALEILDAPGCSSLELETFARTWEARAAERNAKQVGLGEPEDPLMSKAVLLVKGSARRDARRGAKTNPQIKVG